MAYKKVSVNKTSLKPTPEDVEVSRKAGDRVQWDLEGNAGDLFLVSIEKGGCFKGGKGTYQVTIRTGKSRARIRTEGLRASTGRSYKYSITRIRNGRTKSVDPRIKIRE